MAMSSRSHHAIAGRRSSSVSQVIKCRGSWIVGRGSWLVGRVGERLSTNHDPRSTIHDLRPTNHESRLLMIAPNLISHAGHLHHLPDGVHAHNVGAFEDGSGDRGGGRP